MEKEVRTHPLLLYRAAEVPSEDLSACVRPSSTSMGAFEVISPKSLVALNTPVIGASEVPTMSVSPTRVWERWRK